MNLQPTLFFLAIQDHNNILSPNSSQSPPFLAFLYKFIFFSSTYLLLYASFNPSTNRRALFQSRIQLDATTVNHILSGSSKDSLSFSRSPTLSHAYQISLYFSCLPFMFAPHTRSIIANSTFLHIKCLKLHYCILQAGC